MALWEAEDYGSMADKACWAMFAVTAFVVALRLFCRVQYGQKRLGGGPGIDDYITLFCLAVFLATCILVSVGSSYGLGRHYTTLSAEDKVQAAKFNVIISSVLIWSFSLPKFAFISTLKRILNYGPKTTILFWGLAISSQACILATSVWWFEQCHPVAYAWDRTLQGKCASISILADLGYFTSAYSAFLDIFFALYPAPFIMRLNMPFKKRLAIATALSLGVLACIISIYKLAIFNQVFEILATDPTYPVPYLDILGVAEGTILLVCASLPTLGPLVRLATSQLRSRTQTSGNHFGGSQPGNSNSQGSEGWDRLRGNKPYDPSDLSTGTRPSIDVIPLVHRQTSLPHDGIQKTLEVTVSTESLGRRSQHQRMVV